VVVVGRGDGAGGAAAIASAADGKCCVDCHVDDATAWPRPPSAAVRATRQIKAARRAIDVVAYASRLAAAMIGQKRGEL